MAPDNSAYYAFQPPTAASKVDDEPVPEPVPVPEAEAQASSQMSYGTNLRVKTWLMASSQADTELLPFIQGPSSDDEDLAEPFTPPETPASIPSMQSGRTDDIRAQRRHNRKLRGDNPNNWRIADDLAVQDGAYRARNLTENGLHLCSWNAELPEDVAALVRFIQTDYSDSSVHYATLQQLHTKIEQLEIGSSQKDIHAIFTSGILPQYEDHDASACERTADAPLRCPTMSQEYIDKDPSLKVAIPRPSLIYGYRLSAFPSLQQDRIAQLTERTHVKRGGMFPFFALEFKSDGPRGGAHLWAATNKLLGALSSCNSITSGYNRMLDIYSRIPHVPTVVFGVTSNGTEARLYVAWMRLVSGGDLELHPEYNMKKIDSFLLSDVEHLKKLCIGIRAIISWGEKERLFILRKSLDGFAECRARMSENDNIQSGSADAFV